MTEPTKICTACEQELPFSAFHNQAHNPDGKHQRCKRCAMYGPPIEMGKTHIDDSPFDPDLEATRRVEQLVARYGLEEAITKIKLERFAT